VKGGEGAAATDELAIVDLNAGASGGGGGGGGNDLLTNVADSIEVENTTTETNFDQTFTVPVTQLKIGTVLHILASGLVVDNNSTDTLVIRMKVGTETISTTGAIDVADNDVFHVDAYVIVRTLGATGTLGAFGTTVLGVPGTAAAEPFSNAQATEDTTSGLAVVVSAEWSVAHADNEVLLHNLIVDVRN